MPSEHERETAFLRRCIRYDLSATGSQLDERICQVQRDERCLRRAAWLMAVVAMLAIAGLGYGAVLLDDFPLHMSAFTSDYVIKGFCAMGIGSLLCLVVFSCVALIYRRELNHRREECRRRVTKFMDTLVGEPARRPRNGDLDAADAGALRSRPIAPQETAAISVTNPEPVNAGGIPHPAANLDSLRKQ